MGRVQLFWRFWRLMNARNQFAFASHATRPIKRERKKQAENRVVMWISIPFPAVFSSLIFYLFSRIRRAAKKCVNWTSTIRHSRDKQLPHASSNLKLFMDLIRNASCHISNIISLNICLPHRQGGGELLARCRELRWLFFLSRVVHVAWFDGGKPSGRSEEEKPMNVIKKMEHVVKEA